MKEVKEGTFIILLINCPAVCHEAARKMKERPFGNGLHEQFPNRPELLRSKAVVVSVRKRYGQERRAYANR